MFPDTAAITNELNCKDTGSGSGGSTSANCSGIEHPALLEALRVLDNNKCSKARANEINTKLTKFFHFNAISFNLAESDELADLVQALCSSYYNHGLPERSRMSTTGVDIVFHNLHEEVEEHLQRCDELMSNMDGWKNEKNNNSRSLRKEDNLFF